MGRQATEIKICFLNIGGAIFQKEEQLHNMMIAHDIKIMCVCETEIEHFDEKNPFQLRGYKTFHAPKLPDQKFNRLLIFVSDELPCTNRSDLTTAACIWLKVTSHMTKKKILVGAYYREWQQPQYGTQEFNRSAAEAAQEERLTQFGEKVTAAAAEQKSLVVLGDMNLDITRDNEPYYYKGTMLKQYSSMMRKNGSTHLPMGTTFQRIHQNGRVVESEIDHLLANSQELVARHGKLDFPASDHWAICADLRFGVKRQEKISKTGRDMRMVRQNPQQLKGSIARQVWDPLFSSTSVEDMVDYFTNCVTSALNEAARIKTKTLKNGKSKPNFSVETVQLLQRKIKLQRA